MRTFIAALLTACSCVFAAQETKVLVDFEKEEDVNYFYNNDWDEAKQVDNKIPLTKEKNWSDQHATSGKKSLKVTNEYLRVETGDWSGYESLDIDFFVEGDQIINLTVCVADEAWLEKGKNYWNRHNSHYPLKPGKNSVSLPVNGLFRGEAGGRGHDIPNTIDTSKVRRFDLGFDYKKSTVYIDNLRLVKETPPEGVQSFDFGPEQQNVFPGFKPITWNTVYGKNGNKAGLRIAANGRSRARDDTFPTRLYQDWVAFNEDNNEFIVEVPNGKYHGWIMFSDCGYWGGETSKHKLRTVMAEDMEVARQENPDGAADHLYRFENVEPLPGDSLWELYMKHIFQPVRFTAEVKDGTLNIRPTADNWWARVAAVIIYPDDKKEAGEKYVADIEARNRKEFEDKAQFLGPKPKNLDIPAAAKAAGYWLGFPTLEEDVTVEDAPGPADKKLHRYAAIGQRISYTFAIRPLKEFTGAVNLAVTDLAGDGTDRLTRIPAADVDLRYVYHGTSRGFSSITYNIVPHGIKKVAGANLILKPNLTRQFWITVAVPPNAKPGVYKGEVTLTAGELKVSLPLAVEVCDIKLDEPDFNFGFYGLWVPGGRPNAMRDLLTIHKQNGMNSFTGGPDLHFKGFDENGKPIIDFKACDEFFKTVKECGFTRELQSYGGPGGLHGLHDGYIIGNTGREWEKKTGKPFKELLKIVWGAVKEHAEKEGWPPIAYNFCDEPRVLEPALQQVELMKAYREAVPFVKIGGAYSVHWGDSALDKAIQEIFKTLVWSGLNLHTETDRQKAKEFGREIYIYNQGTSRFSFGMYQWAEMRKEVKGRMQWHNLALHGYQFFDLDGREPDTAAVNWGRNELIPTIRLPRCREGSDDFRFAVTLYNLAQKKKDAPEAQAALKFLEEVNQAIKYGERNPPKGFAIDDETFRNTCVEHIKKLK
ncbi:MAG TPA: hypothetical protein VEJ63_14625 [Planctomycetota bacterium]|nr:hypothetical protein [Planctomycetota bacterium]